MTHRRGGFDDRDMWEQRAPSRGPPVREFEDLDIRVRERDRVPAFMRDDGRRAEPGPLVLRQRDIETVERPRRRSPSVTRVRAETKIVERKRSLTPPPRREFLERDDVRIRHVERDRVRSPSRVRIVERERSPSPPSPVHERIRARVIERGRSPSPDLRDRIRIVERQRQRARSVSSSPSPSPPPPPQVIKGPTIEREVITHYRDIDHGVVHAHTPTPPPPRVRTKERDTEIDIWTSRNETEVDIHKHSRSRGRSRSRSVERRLPRVPTRVYDDEVLVRADRDHLQVDIDHLHHRSTSRHRRAHSAAPPVTTRDDEAEYITSRINERGRIGEAYHGHTKDWTIVDVPPGTERVRMDGAGGGGAEVTWSKYAGVRRAKFIPEADGTLVTTSSSASLSDTRDRDRDRDRGGDRVNVTIYDSDREREVDVERVTDRRVSIRTPAPRGKKGELWTEITKDLVIREAIEQLGYQYEETEFFYYILQYLQYEDVLELVRLSDDIIRARKDRLREVKWEREHHIDWDREQHHRHRHHRQSVDRYDDERIVEREVVFENRAPSRFRG